MLFRKKPKRIMGIDSSSKSMAYAILDNGKLVEYGIVNFQGVTLNERLVDARRKLTVLKKRFKVDMVAAEGAVFVRNQVSFIALIKMFGTIESVVSEGVKYVEYKPLSWYSKVGLKTISKTEKDDLKKSYPGKSASWYQVQARQMKKQRTLDWTKTTFHVNIDDDNIADAIGVAQAAYLENK